MSTIQFFTEDLDFCLSDKVTLRHWIEKIIGSEGNKTIQSINFIFCSDPYLRQMNLDYLNHDYFTDVITFDNSDSENSIESDIFISIERVRNNSSSRNIDFEEELHRVMIHGILHLLGYSDKTETEREIMRKKENECLTLL